LGKKTEVLLEGESSQHSGRLCGRNPQNIMVNLEASYPELKPGMLAAVEVIEAGKYTLRGRLCS
jgi:tRNA A37 methylthiotransferase MiaB